MVGLRVVSYNIRHCRGNDGRLDVTRTAEVLRSLSPDLVGLQEVDQGTQRAQGIPQASELGRRLGMYSAFGAFMPYDGGHYGMGMLSKFPLRNVRSIRLPEGNEPRIALYAEAQLGGGEPVAVVNVHFDWVDDDGFRFAQATYLAEAIRKIEMPYILLGDFNDQPGSRTISMFRSLATEVPKPPDDHFTFSSDKPEKEIDFIFVAPKKRWILTDAHVIDEPMASDHRPFFGSLETVTRAEEQDGN